MSSQLTQHPLSSAFPAMSAEDFQSLCDSIESIGVQNPITLYEGMVIDGWHRYRAASGLGMDCPTVDLGDVDPRDFVIAQNKARRHILPVQLLVAVKAVYAWAPAHRPNKSATVADLTSKQASEKTGVSVRNVERFREIEKKAAPEVIASVIAGETGLAKGAAIAKLPKEEQAAAIHKPAPKARPEPIEAPEDDGPSAEEMAAPEPQPEAPPEYTELDAARDQIGDLQTEIERLSDRLAVEAIDASEEEKTAASETIAGLRAEVQTLTAHLAAVTISRDTLQEENAQLKKQCQMYRNKLDKLSA